MAPYEERWARHEADLAWQERERKLCRSIARKLEFHVRPIDWVSLPDGQYAIRSRSGETIGIVPHAHQAVKIIDLALKAKW